MLAPCELWLCEITEQQGGGRGAEQSPRTQWRQAFLTWCSGPLRPPGLLVSCPFFKACSQGIDISLGCGPLYVSSGHRDTPVDTDLLSSLNSSEGGVMPPVCPCAQGSWLTRRDGGCRPHPVRCSQGPGPLSSLPQRLGSPHAVVLRPGGDQLKLRQAGSLV